MAKPRPTPEPEEELVLPLTPAEAALEEVRAKLSGLQGDGTATVYIMRGDTAMKKGKLPLRKVLDDTDVIGKTYGGGVYHVDFAGPDGQWIKRFVELAFDPLTYGPEKDLTATSKPATPGVTPEIQMLMHRLDAQAERDREREARDREAAQRQHELMLEMIRSSHSGSRLDEVLNAVRQLQPPGGLDVDKIAGLLDTLNGLRGKVADAEPGDGLSTAIKEGVKLLAPYLDRAAAPAPAPTRPPVPNPAPTAAPKPPEAPAMNGHAIMAMVYRQAVPQLCNAADQGVSPEVAAAELDAKTPEEFSSVLHDLLARPDLVPYLARYDARVMRHAEWFKAVAQHVLSLYEDEAVEPAEPASA